MPAIVFLVQRIGPYHHARLGAFAAISQRPLTVIEFRPADDIYAWNPVADDGKYARRATRSKAELNRVLEEIGAEVVVCTGYADPEVHQAAAWAHRRGAALVACSDSTYDDEPRSWLKEAFKRRVLAAFDAALVAGKRARGYVISLGMRRDACFNPWDVVDNAHFERGANHIRGHTGDALKRLGLPVLYFLCVARFVPKKNVAGLIEAFARYSTKAGRDAWPLVLSGSGPLEGALRDMVSSAGLDGRVHFRGFLQYEELPACYGLAGAFVLPSTSDQWGLVVNEAMACGLPVIISRRCGCEPDLLADGENGFAFEPSNATDLEECLGRMASLAPSEREKMGRRSREIISGYTPESFAWGLSSAVEHALACRRSREPGHTGLLLRLLANRPRRNP